MNKSTTRQREQWLMKARTEGERLKRGALSHHKRLTIKAIAWLKALRLQFYPMTFVAYTMGAFAADRYGYEFNSLIFWTGYIWLFFLEAATVLLNEYFDYSADKDNRYFGPFTGGSRVLVDKLLTFSQIKQGIAVSLGLALITLIILLVSLKGSVNAALLTSLALTILALGYTVPPLKLSYHSLGEVTVGVTHSFAVIICGYLFMGGHISDQFPWLIGLPLFLAVLPSIILAGIPDYDSDKEAGKKTFAVRFGKKSAARLAMAFTWLASATLIGFSAFNVLPDAFSGVYYFAIPHAFLLSFFLTKYIYHPGSSKRIDSLMVMSLIYLIWFGLIPLINLS